MYLFLVLDNMLATTVFELLDTIKNDEDRQVVMVAYDVMTDLLKEIGTPVLMSTPNNSDINVIFNQIVASVIAAFNHKVGTDAVQIYCSLVVM